MFIFSITNKQGAAKKRYKGYWQITNSRKRWKKSADTDFI